MQTVLSLGCTLKCLLFAPGPPSGPGSSHGVDAPALCATPLVGTVDIQSTKRVVCFTVHLGQGRGDEGLRRVDQSSALVNWPSGDVAGSQGRNRDNGGTQPFFFRINGLMFDWSVG